MNDRTTTDLYRYFDAEGRLLYVGISFSAIARASQHRQDKGWWAHFTRMEVERFDTRADALAAEAAAIRTEAPIHNVAGNSNPAALNTMAPWRCRQCRRPIGLTKEDGFLQINERDEWHCVCAKCDEVPNPRYWIDACRVQSLEDIRRWTTHLCEKNWFDQSTWTAMVRLSCILPQASSHAFLAFDAYRDQMRRRDLNRTLA